MKCQQCNAFFEGSLRKRFCSNKCNKNFYSQSRRDASRTGAVVKPHRCKSCGVLINTVKCFGCQVQQESNLKREIGGRWKNHIAS